MQNDNEDLIIIGLGNPGSRYKQSLHNVGFKVVERLATMQGWSWKLEDRFQAEVSRGKCQNVTYHLIKPETFMNLSGLAVKEYLRYFNLSPRHLVVIADDADLLFGEIRLKPFGGSGGHNGLKSIERELLTSQFKRLRFGIGRPVIAISLADYVLMHQDQETWKRLDPAIDKAAIMLEKLANEPFENVMKAANTKAANGEKVDENRDTKPI